jgi:hypothetical protein
MVRWHRRELERSRMHWASKLEEESTGQALLSQMSCDYKNLGGE